MSDSAPISSTPEGGTRLPAKIGRYEIVEKIGSGSSGTVYRATDPFIGRVLAIKTFRVDLQPGPTRDRFLQRFYHEARISGGLSHPNIVALFDVGEMDGLPYLVFEHVEGPTLDVALARTGRLDSAETIRVVEQTASALDFAHAHGVVHRDIRPANIILARDKRIRIADFGIARVEGSQLTQHGEILGTPAYMSPEQIRGEELSPETDLFSLAVCAYEMLSGQRPFMGKNQAELLEALVYAPPSEPKELRILGIPSRDFMFVFERALAKDPAHRFANAASFARALKSCLGVVVSDEAPPPVTRIAVPEAPAALRRAILPPVAPPLAEPVPPEPVPTAPAPAPEPRPPAFVPKRFDTAATAAIDVAAAGLDLANPADGTLVSTGSTDPGLRGLPEPPSASQPLPPEPPPPPPPQDDPSEATLVTTVGFDQGLNARKLESLADATMAAALVDIPSASPPRMSRQEVESLLARSAASQAEGISAIAPALQKTLPGSEKTPTSSSHSAIEGLLPPTREMARSPLGSAPSLDGPSISAPRLHESSGSRSADKTVIMTDTEKAAAARVRLPEPRVQEAPPIPRPVPPPPPPPKTATAKVPTLPPAPALARPPGSSLVPKILLGGLALLTLLAVLVAAIFWSRAGRTSGQPTAMWNDLPVYPEADVEKSPLLVIGDLPSPKLEPGRVVSVTLAWIVTPEGTVDDIRVVVSAAPEIDAFVMEGIRKWKYEPGVKGNKTVPVRVLRKYTFPQRGSSGS